MWLTRWRLPSPVYWSYNIIRSPINLLLQDYYQHTTVCAPTTNGEADFTKLKDEVKSNDEIIKELENDRLELKETVKSLQSGESSLEKHGKTYPLDEDVYVWCHRKQRANEKCLPLIPKLPSRVGITLDEVLHRTTVELRSRELEVVSEFLAAETAGSENVTLGFDATTQGSFHVNSIHITSNTHCHIIAVDQLPACIAEEYELHMNDSTDCVTDVYCTNFEDIHRKTLVDISKTMTDNSLRKPCNRSSPGTELEDTIASSVRTAIKANDHGDLVKKLFGFDCIAQQLVLAINKFQYKDGRGTQRGSPLL